MVLIEEKLENINISEVFFNYLKQGHGLCVNISMLSLAVLPAVLIVLFRLRVMHWVSEPLVQQQLLLSRGEVSALAVLVLLTGGIGGLIVPLVFLRTSRSLHDAMLERVSRAPMSFFISKY